MIEASVLVIYVLIVLGFVFIPGQPTLLTAARATTSGTRMRLATGAGITVGDVEQVPSRWLVCWPSSRRLQFCLL